MPTRDDYEPGRPSWVDLGTSDPAAARAFYGELFGWSADVDPRPEAGGYAQFMRDGKPVAGCGPLFVEGMPPAWTSYVATADADATAKVAADLGGTVVTEPFDVLDAGRMAALAAPDGSVIGVWQAKAHKGAALVNEPGSWQWNQLLTRDKAAADAFYAPLFGWQLRSHPQWGEYWSLGDGEVTGVSELCPKAPAEVPAHWQVVFTVEDAEATLARAGELGGSALGPTAPWGPGGRFGTIADPQGATFGVLSLPASG
ncbi:VOC family protein [soil metagenome]